MKSGSEGLVDRLWVAWPLSAGRFLPWQAAGLIDGQWLTRWPAVALGLPGISAAAGLLLGTFHPGAWVAQLLGVVVVLYALSLLAMKLGWWACGGFLMGYLPERTFGGDLDPVAGFFAGLLGTLLLGLLLVVFPLLVARVVAELVRALGERGPRVPLLMLAAGVTAGALGWIWPQAVAVLSRPLSTWDGGSPSTADIAPLQHHAWLSVFVVVGVGAAGARVVAERRITGRARRRAETAAVQWPVLSGSRLPDVDPRLGIIWRALGTTFLMAGLLTAWWQALATFVTLLLLLLARSALAHAPWWSSFARVPTLVRLVVGLFLGLLVNRAILAVTFSGSLWNSSGSMLPVLIGALVGIAAIVLLTSPSERPHTPRSEQRSLGTPAVVFLGVALALVHALGDVPAARADNCSSLSDCFFTIAAALLVIALLALLIALLLASGPPGWALAGGGALANAAAVTAATNVAVAAAQGAAVTAAAGVILQMASQGTPGNNQAQNKQFRDAVRRAERDLGRRLSKNEIRQVHDTITGQDYGFHEIVEEILNMFGGG